MVALYVRESILVVSQIHSSIGPPSPLMAQSLWIPYLHFQITRSQLTLVSFQGLIWLCSQLKLCLKKKKISDSIPEPWIVFVNDVDFLPGSTTLSRALKVTKRHGSMIASSNWTCSPVNLSLTALGCSKFLASSCWQPSMRSLKLAGDPPEMVLPWTVNLWVSLL